MVTKGHGNHTWRTVRLQPNAINVLIATLAPDENPDTTNPLPGAAQHANTSMVNTRAFMMRPEVPSFTSLPFAGSFGFC